MVLIRSYWFLLIIISSRSPFEQQELADRQGLLRISADTDTDTDTDADTYTCFSKAGVSHVENTYCFSKNVHRVYKNNASISLHTIAIMFTKPLINLQNRSLVYKHCSLCYTRVYHFI